jgi:Ca2+-binding RTX toxin-like protein
MNLFRREGRRRRLPVVAFAGVLFAFQAIALVGANTAAAAATCAYASGVMTIDLAADNSVEVAQDSATGTVLVDFAECTPVAPIANVTTINIDGNTGDEWVGIEMWDNDDSNVAVDWGTVNWNINLGSDSATSSDEIYIDGFPLDADNPIDVVWGVSGIDLNNDGDLDVSPSGVEIFEADGGDGDDSLSAAGSTATGAALAAKIALYGNAGDDTLIGGAGNDSGLLDDGDSAGLFGGADDDTLSGGLGDDVVDGGADEDVADYSASATAVNANLTTGKATGEGFDTLTAIEDLYGSALGDTLTGDTGDNYITGAAGDDKIDCVDTGDEDTADFSDSAAGVTVDLDAGTATGDGTDTLANCEDVQGSDFDDVIAGDDGDNALFGGAGNDSISGGTADDDSDIIDGEAGSDWVDYSTRTDPVTVDLTSGSAGGTAGACNDVAAIVGPPAFPSEFVNGEVDDGETDCITGTENAALGTGDDTFVGNAFSNTVQPGGGQNSLTGAAGSDTIDYSVGYDAGVTVNLAGGSASDDAIDSFENVIGTAFADNITGDDGSNTLKSRKGSDNVRGGSGDDTVKAGAGNDLVRGGTGDDDLWGQKGNDSLNGGKGSDFCKGGPGKDKLKSCESGHK